MLLSEAFLYSIHILEVQGNYENLSWSVALFLHVGCCRNKSVEEKFTFFRHLRMLWDENQKMKRSRPLVQSFMSEVF